MKNEPQSNIPSISEFKKFLNNLIDGPEETKSSYDSEEYIQFLETKIWDDYDYTIDDMMSGDDIRNPNRRATDAFVSLRRTLSEKMDHNDFLIMQIAEDCDQRLDDLVLQTEQKVAANELTGPEYLEIKRSANVLRVILLSIASRIDRVEAEASVKHPLKPITKENLRKILQVSTTVEQHLESMLEAVNKESLKAEPKAWIAAGVAVLFALLYMSSFFALDKHKSAIEQILYFLGIR